MKPRVKNDSRVYTVAKTAARRKVKRLSHKRHRRNDREVTALGYYGEAGSPAMSMVNHTDADCVLVWEAVEVGSMALGF